MVSAAEIVEHVDHFRRRVLADALQEATAAYWERRAEVFEAARPRRGDYFGNATRDDLRAQDERLAAMARACRSRAAVSLLGGEDW